MKIVPIASDSMGIRSMSIFIEDEYKIIIDPSASLGPYRYGLRPTKIEYDYLLKFKKVIKDIAKKCDIIIITHYHYDHYDPDEDFYENKILLIKDGKNKINRSQKIRFDYFVNKIKNYEFADSKTFNFGKISLKFSEPLHHGNEESKLGYVISVVIESDKKFLFSSDVEGPIVENVADFIIKENPEIAVIDGPPTYFLGYRFSDRDLNRSIENLKRIAREIDTVILDHHLLRDLKYRERLNEVYSSGNVMTFAEFKGEEINMLEAHRKDLYRSGEKEVNVDFEE